MTTPKNRFRLLLLLLITPVMAQATTVGIGPIIKTFQPVTQGWYHAIFTDAMVLFGKKVELTRNALVSKMALLTNR